MTVYDLEGSWPKQKLQHHQPHYTETIRRNIHDSSQLWQSDGMKITIKECQTNNHEQFQKNIFNDIQHSLIQKDDNLTSRNIFYTAKSTSGGTRPVK